MLLLFFRKQLANFGKRVRLFDEQYTSTDNILIPLILRKNADIRRTYIRTTCSPPFEGVRISLTPMVSLF